MTPQEAARRRLREAEIAEQFRQLAPDHRRIVLGVVERMATCGECLEDALEAVAGVRTVADLPNWHTN